MLVGLGLGLAGPDGPGPLAMMYHQNVPVIADLFFSFLDHSDYT